MQWKRIAVANKQIYLFRHGHSKSNFAYRRPLPFSPFVQFVRNSIGLRPALKTVEWLDTLSGNFKPYKLPDAEIPLVELGHQQAELTGMELARRGILPDRIISSEYLRAKQTTMGIISGIEKATGSTQELPIHYSAEIVERKSGRAQGFPKEYVRVLFPDIFEQWNNLDDQEVYTYRPPEGESIYDIRHDRIPSFLEIINQLEFNTLFIVAHGITNMALRSLLTGEELTTIKSFSPNLGVCRFWEDQETNSWILDRTYDGTRPISKEIPITR